MTEKWSLTFKGLLDNDMMYNEILLYMYKNKYNGIALEHGVLSFVKFEKKTVKKKKKKGKK